ncbi:MAG: hypothetical protein M1823_004666 [Watsoniomyces obsoletus]|nr:MAG: hypothetical protein M1823_004666 [Watsoniomyces obsoletus]
MQRPWTTTTSSQLGAEIRGDTGAPALSTMDSSTISFLRSSSPADPSKTRRKPYSKRRKARSLLRRWKTISLRHTWINPMILVLLVLMAYGCNPSTSNPFRSALYLSYPLDTNTPFKTRHYGKGRLDIAFVAFYVIVLSFTREFIMQVLLRPLAIRGGIKNRHKQSRFMEQMYTVVYFALFGPFGLWVMSKTPVWYFNTTAFFVDFPHRTLSGPFKAYYLLQAAYWVQQAIVLLLQLERPRKDFRELVGHHIITIALIGLSYRFHFTSMGLAVYITHDVSDLFLAASKSLSYIEARIVGPFFATFIAIWIYLRHYINLHILWATLTEFRTIGPYELNWATEQYKGPLSQVIAFILLASIQALNLFWLFLILRIAKNYVFNNVKADEIDERSEFEDDDEVDGAVVGGGEQSVDDASGGTTQSLKTHGNEGSEMNGDVTIEGSTTGIQRGEKEKEETRRRLLEGDVPGWIFEKDVSTF